MGKLDLPADGTEGSQVNMFTSKILDFCKDGTNTNAMSNLTSLANTFESCQEFFPSCPKLSAEAGLLKMGMHASRNDFVLGEGGCTEDRLNSFLNEPSEVLKALGSLPFGRGIILQAKTALEQGKAKHASVSHWQREAAALGTFADFGFLARFEPFKKSVEEGLIASEVLRDVVTLPFLQKFTIEIFVHVEELARSGTS